MKIYYDTRNGRLNVYKLEDSIFKHVGGCNFNHEFYFTKELEEKVFEIFSEKNKDVKLEDLEFMDLRFLNLEKEVSKQPSPAKEALPSNRRRRR